MNNSNYIKNETKLYKESADVSSYTYDSDVIEIVNVNDNERGGFSVTGSNNFERVSDKRTNYNMSRESSSDIEIIEDINYYNYEKVKEAKIREFEQSNRRAEFVRNEGVYFEYYLGCIDTDSIILSSEICEVRNDRDVTISYEITPKSTKRSYSPMYNLKINNHYVISNDYIKIIGRNIPTNTNKVKKKKVLKNKGNSTSGNEDYSELHYDCNKVISADKKYIEYDKNKAEVLKDINEGYSCIRIKHNNRDISKLKSHLSKILSVLLVLNAIRIEIKLEKVSLCDLKFGGSLKTFIHVILYPDSFKIDSHKFHEYNSLIKYSVDHLFKELKITPLRFAKCVDMDSFENSNIKISKEYLSPLQNSVHKIDTFSCGKKDKSMNNSWEGPSGFSTPHKALGVSSTPKKALLGSSSMSRTKEEEEIVDTLSENEVEDKNEEATNLVFLEEEKYRGGYLLEDFEEIHPNDFYFKPTLKTYQAEGVWWMYTRENPPEYSKEKDNKNVNIKEIIIDDYNKSSGLLDSSVNRRIQVRAIINDRLLPSSNEVRCYVVPTESGTNGGKNAMNMCKLEQSNKYVKMEDEGQRVDGIDSRLLTDSCSGNGTALSDEDDQDNREDLDDIRNKVPLNPIWEEHAFIPKIRIYEKGIQVCVLKYFYVNKLTGCFSLTYPQYVPAFRGGILADEMGLGKTIQSIGLIAHDIYQNKLHIKNNDVENKNNFTYLIENTIKGFNYKKGGTLIIAPLALIYQWKQEIERHTKEGFISSYIYYGNSKDITGEELSKHSVVLTTYATLVAEYKNTLNKKGTIKGSNHSGSNVDEENDTCKREKKHQSGENEIGGEKNVLGNKKKMNNFFMKTVLSKEKTGCDSNSVKRGKTVGGGNASGMNAEGGNMRGGNAQRNKYLVSKKECPLYKITWRRIIIDEAHVIKNKNAIQSIAVWKLMGERKWCLTGTPIQNSLYDIFPLFRFLGIKPYGTIEWWNKEIVDYVNKNKLNIALDVVRKISSPILLRRTKKSKTKDGDNIIYLPKKNIHLMKLEFTLEEEDFYRAIFYRSKTKFDTYMHDGNVLSHYSHVLQLLLRLRQCCSHPLLLFSKPFFEEWNKEDIINDVFQKKKESSKIKNNNSVVETDTNMDKTNMDKTNMDKTNMDETNICYEKDVRNKIMGNNLIYNFLIGSTNSKRLDDDYINEFEILKNGNVMQCIICLEDAVYPLISKCLHIMCKKCADDYFHLTQIADKKCPECNNYISLKSLKTLQENKSPLDELLKKMKKENFVYSTKLKTLFYHIQNDMINELHIVVFSQWIGFLKIIQKLLTLHNIPNRIYDGSLSYEQRKNILHWFNIQKGKIYQPGIGFIKPSYDIPMENIAGKVLLCSLKAGGVGLNLTVSSKVYLMDLWWNPAIEDQAFERVHRIGQLHDVNIYKFVLEKTVEERILQIHQSKQYTANQVLAQVGNKINTEVNFAPQKLGMEDFILMFKDWSAEE
ncbi:DNA repair protein RAD5, putative (RAD5) [Plasmodium ovale wallikeri]|uniref:DNA repair protein RAD5, putative (RAD5) n=1 Tax=Plasmodium ovale wallikeri TaxID=864142 RepID=A0A1A8Z9Y2_PLAOA|nr:DNA repair protein RAD5, putative (RAD5) [Plasmodium ovale wallikeri]